MTTVFQLSGRGIFQQMVSFITYFYNAVMNYIEIDLLDVFKHSFAVWILPFSLRHVSFPFPSYYTLPTSSDVMPSVYITFLFL
jgi:hypothetical protein